MFQPQFCLPFQCTNAGVQKQEARVHIYYIIVVASASLEGNKAPADVGSIC